MSSNVPLAPDEASRTAVTHRYEQRRSAAQGILETAATTFLVLIAVQWFHAGANAKAMVAMGSSAGLLLTPLVVSVVAKRRWRASAAASAIAAFGAVIFLLMAAAPVLPVFVAGSVAGMAATSAMVPLLTQIYQENYPAGKRGHLFSRTVIIRIGAAALFSEFAGQMLSEHLSYFRVLLLVFAASFAYAGYCLSKVPSLPLPDTGGSHPLKGMRFVRSDPLFRRTLICWMLMGIANLMMLPIRVEYLANPKYGLAFTAAEVAFLTGVAPNLARLIMSPIWGWLFDTMNFFLLRVVLNLGFALGIVSFFTTSDVSGLILGAVIFGVSASGGDVAWSLWVTKFAPAGHVADYMSVHTFFTGVRGVIAPWLAFQLAGFISVVAMGWITGTLIVLATLLLVPEIKFGKFGRKAAALVEEFSD